MLTVDYPGSGDDGEFGRCIDGVMYVMSEVLYYHLYLDSDEFDNATARITTGDSADFIKLLSHHRLNLICSQLLHESYHHHDDDDSVTQSDTTTLTNWQANRCPYATESIACLPAHHDSLKPVLSVDGARVVIPPSATARTAFEYLFYTIEFYLHFQLHQLVSELKYKQVAEDEHRPYVHNWSDRIHNVRLSHELAMDKWCTINKMSIDVDELTIDHARRYGWKALSAHDIRNSPHHRRILYQLIPPPLRTSQVWLTMQFFNFFVLTRSRSSSSSSSSSSESHSVSSSSASSSLSSSLWWLSDAGAHVSSYRPFASFPTSCDSAEFAEGIDGVVMLVLRAMHLRFRDTTVVNWDDHLYALRDQSFSKCSQLYSIDKEKMDEWIGDSCVHLSEVTERVVPQLKRTATLYTVFQHLCASIGGELQANLARLRQAYEHASQRQRDASPAINAGRFIESTVFSGGYGSPPITLYHFKPEYLLGILRVDESTHNVGVLVLDEQDSVNKQRVAAKRLMENVREPVVKEWLPADITSTRITGYVSLMYELIPLMCRTSSAWLAIRALHRYCNQQWQLLIKEKQRLAARQASFVSNLFNAARK